ncbi:MAG: hypothetical protein ACYC27_17215 [Armatimonadota bacterium]
MKTLLCLLSACTILTAISPAECAGNNIKTVGLYSFRPAPDNYYKFWRASGYNMLQFIDHSFSAPPNEKDAYYVNLVKGIADAQKAGFKVNIIILSNVSSYPEYPNPSVFNPTDKKLMQKRLDDIEIGIKRLKGADIFTFFGGDPGGSPEPLGPDGVTAWQQMAEKVRVMVKREAPKAKFNVNVWAVTAWENIANNPFKADFWIKEVEYSKVLMADESFVRPDTGVEFPLHNYYRSLALKAYSDAGKTPEVYPVASDTKMLKSRGVKQIWGWAHFLIDEVDDGYTGYSGVRAHPAQAETRYLHRIVSDARSAGLNGMISNSDGEGLNSAIEAMNVYAFARFCNNPALTPEKAIDEYAGHLADKATKHNLGQVIRFIENHSTWEKSIPEQYRIKSFECDFKSAKEALAALASVQINPKPGIPLPEPARTYLDRLKDRLQDISAAEDVANEPKPVKE